MATQTVDLDTEDVGSQCVTPALLPVGVQTSYSSAAGMDVGRIKMFGTNGKEGKDGLRLLGAPFSRQKDQKGGGWGLQ